MLDRKKGKEKKKGKRDLSFQFIFFDVQTGDTYRSKFSQCRWPIGRENYSTSDPSAVNAQNSFNSSLHNALQTSILSETFYLLVNKTLRVLNKIFEAKKT